MHNNTARTMCIGCGADSYPISAMLRDYGAVFPKLEKANAAAGVTRYDHYTKAGYELDHMSARAWIERNVPGGLQSDIGWLLDIDATTENGGESSDAKLARAHLHARGHAVAQS